MTMKTTNLIQAMLNRKEQKKKVQWAPEKLKAKKQKKSHRVKIKTAKVKI
jgi:hypothetical protein